MTDKHSENESDQPEQPSDDTNSPSEGGDPLESTVDSINESLKGASEAVPNDNRVPELFRDTKVPDASGVVKPFGIDLVGPVEVGKEFDTTQNVEELDSEGSSRRDESQVALEDTTDIEEPVDLEDTTDVNDLANAGSATGLEDTTDLPDSQSIDETDSAISVDFDERREPTLVLSDESESDQTQLDFGDTVQLSGSSSVGEFDQTIQLDSEETRGDSSVDIDGPTVRLGTGSDSVETLDREDIGQTINPRELSDEDLDFWGSLLTGSGDRNTSPSGEVTNLRPAIDRSISETNLQIRARDVTTPKQSAGAQSDYRLIRLLGKGGMGNVFVAKQSSLDRLVAVKVIKPLEGKKRKKLERQRRLKEVEEDRRHQFLSEAVVTGDLDHPNIVPIHDIAVTGDNTLFYSMKRVVGTPWSKVIKKNSRDENIDILMKVCDAIGFAHTRGVVHRDIKPENIMLGDFGVVLVMDWGLALAKPEFEKIDSIAHTAGLGGTPAFMAPEMAKGPIEKIGPASDVYLLGATLFLIITGTAPHQASSVSECIRAVAANEIRDYDETFRGELLNIALKAMATEPEDRYSDVQSFQDAIREYRAHSESIAIARSAEADYRRGVADGGYNDFSRATFGYERAIGLWEGNRRARVGLAKTTLAHADAAYENEDFDLGLSILDESEPSHQPLIEKLNAGLKERESRQSRLKQLRRLAIAMLAFILIGGSIALYFINDQRQKAITARGIAESQTDLANRKTDEANKARDEADDEREKATKARDEADYERKIADGERVKAEAQRKKAEEQRIKAENLAIEAVAARSEAVMEKDRADEKTKEAEREKIKADRLAAVAVAEKERVEYEVYLSQIGLAKARIERNEFDDARRILRELRDSRGVENLGWEWRWLWHRASQSKTGKKVSASLIDLDVHGEGRRGLTVLDNGSIELFSLAAGGDILAQKQFDLDTKHPVTAAAFSPDGNTIVVGTAVGDILVWDATLTKMTGQLTGHESKITHLSFAADGRLLSSSTDRTARIWDVRTARQTAALWHIAPVRDFSIGDRDGTSLLVTAVADRSSGRAVVWDINNTIKPKRIGEFRNHKRPVVCVAISPDGRRAASGDSGGNVLVWSPVAVRKIDYERSVANAIRNVSGKEQLGSPSTAQRKQKAMPLIDPALASSMTRLVSTRQTTASSPRAHSDIVETLQFSSDGKQLLSGADDYTLKLWGVASGNLQKTLRGHGGWVTRAQYVGDRIVSVSKDATIRTWNPRRYIEKLQFTADRSKPRVSQGPIASRPHEDEIWSARFGPAGQRVVSASRDHTARILEIDRESLTFREVAKLRRDDVSDSKSRLNEGTEFLAMSAAIDRIHGNLFVGSADSTVRIWDLVAGTEIGQVSGTGLNSSLALSRNGRLLLTGSSSRNAKAILWGVDPDGQSAPKLLYRLSGHEQAVTAFAISPSGRTLFTGDRAGIGWLWDTATGKRVGSAIELVRGYRINAAEFTPDGKSLLIAADDQQLTRIDVQTRQRISRLSHDGFVTQLSLSADGQTALTVSELTSEKQFKATARIWNLQSGRSRVLDRIGADLSSDDTSRKRGVRIASVQFGGQNRLAIVCRSAGQNRPAVAKVWDLSKPNSAARLLELPRRLGPAQLAMPMTGDTMLSLNGDAAFLWNLQTKNHEKSYRAHAALTQASFSFDGKFVATGSRSIKIWDSSTGAALGKIEVPHRGPVRGVQFALSGPRYVLASVGDDGKAKVWLWNAATRKISQLGAFELRIDGEGAESAIMAAKCVAFSKDGQSLLVGGVGGVAKLYSLKTSKLLNTFRTTGVGAFTCCRFSPDGEWVVIGSDDKRARVWPTEGEQQPILLEGHADQIEDVAFLQDGSGHLRILTASLDKSARVWDPRLESPERRAREIIALRRHALGVTAVDATDDGELVMTAGRDGTVILWPATLSSTQVE